MDPARVSGDSSQRSHFSTTASNTNSCPTTPTISDRDSKSQPESPGLPDNDDEEEEEYPEDPVRGWPKVASFMAETPDFASFGRFRDLNIKSLLYYQAELTRLRKQLHEAEWRDHRTGTARMRKYAKRADFLVTSRVATGETGDEGPSQWDIMKEIRLVLKEYNEALLQYTQVCALSAPEPSNMRTFQNWLREPTETGNRCIGGKGEENTWGPIYELDGTGEEEISLTRQFFKMLWHLLWPRTRIKDDLDLVATRPLQKVDGFTRWVADEFVPFHNNLTKYRERKRSLKDLEKKPRNTTAVRPPQKKTPKEPRQETLTTYSESSMLRFTSSVSTVAACLLPTVAITVLSKVNGLDHLLICLAGFATLFSVGLIFLTSSTTSRVEIFTATAAFSAVLVVFISVPPMPSAAVP